MALISGNQGSVEFDASSLCPITGFDLTIDQAVLTTVTHCSAPWTITARGNKTVTGNITAKVDSAQRLEALFLTDALVALELVTNGSSKWSGNARLGQITTGANIETGEIETISCAFTGDGAWTFA